MKHARPDYNRRIIDLDNKIPEDEPVFLLRGQDKLAPRLLLMWATELRLAGGDPEMARSAENHAQEMIKWQSTHECKTPDMYQDVEGKRLILNKINSIISSGKTREIRELTTLMADYSNDGKDHLMVLLRTDLKPEAQLHDFDQLELDHFVIEDPIQLRHAKLVIFTNNTNFKVLRNNL